MEVHSRRLYDNTSRVEKDIGQPVDNKNGSCGKFSKSFEENLNIVLNYTFNISNDYLVRLLLDNAGIEKLSKHPFDTKTPVFVTAASSNHFGELQDLIENLRTNVTRNNETMKMIIYDIGLNETQSQLVRKICECEYRLFPFYDYPSYFKILINYTWKPVIIQLVLIEYDFVMWIDSSVRFNGSPLSPLYEEARTVEVKILHGWDPIIRNTHLNTFNALGEAPCMFKRREIQAGWILVKRTNFTLRAIMKPWVSCALQFGCMAQDNAEIIILSPDERNEDQYHVCHRFDQSVIAIILTRLFNDGMDLVYGNMTKYGYIWRG
ncbi:hypothetical protein FSP39_019165 [Pinctada imbricata]|uniref:Uncharacterized protein n=1 Tax=Pinctada imbricata TaxID=66713 RepID=A0AA89BL33_PINIB|nr:hypothetical protein FSP39_019165 [Pinctada imbricata]